jgi:hypothetical protein
MTMRKLEPGFIGRHLATVGDRALSSVGAYQFEGEGIQLFERIDGDYFTIIGLPHASAAWQSCANWKPSMAESELGNPTPRFRHRRIRSTIRVRH